jgi:hypothetical protein
MAGEIWALALEEARARTRHPRARESAERKAIFFFFSVSGKVLRLKKRRGREGEVERKSLKSRIS